MRQAECPLTVHVGRKLYLIVHGLAKPTLQWLVTRAAVPGVVVDERSALLGEVCSEPSCDLCQNVTSGGQQSDRGTRAVSKWLEMLDNLTEATEARQYDRGYRC